MTRARTQEQAAPRKTSETFLDFVAPLVDALGAEATDDQLEHVLQIGFTVWNAVVIDAANTSNRFVDQLQDLTRHDPAVGALVEQLVARKRRLFADDQRLIGHYQLYRDHGELRLRAEARRPNATP